MPNLLTGLRLGMGISWAYLVLGELTGVPDGLGAVIMDARMLGPKTDMILVGILFIALVGRLCDRLLVNCCESAPARRLELTARQTATPLLELVGLGHWFSRSEAKPVLDDLSFSWTTARSSAWSAAAAAASRPS